MVPAGDTFSRQHISYAVIVPFAPNVAALQAGCLLPAHVYYIRRSTVSRPLAGALSALYAAITMSLQAIKPTLPPWRRCLTTLVRQGGECAGTYPLWWVAATPCLYRLGNGIAGL